MIEAIFGIVAGLAVSLGALFAPSLIGKKRDRRAEQDPPPPLPPPRYRIRKRNGAWEVRRVTHMYTVFGNPCGEPMTTRRELVGAYPTWQKAIHQTTAPAPPDPYPPAPTTPGAPGSFTSDGRGNRHDQ